MMALRKNLILRSPHSGRLEGRTDGSPSQIKGLFVAGKLAAREPRRESAGPNCRQATLRNVRLCQTSDSAATSASMSSSLCSGVGVSRSRSVPRATVGKLIGCT